MNIVTRAFDLFRGANQTDGIKKQDEKTYSFNPENYIMKVMWTTGSESSIVYRTHKLFLTLNLHQIREVLRCLLKKDSETEIYLPGGTHLLFDHLTGISSRSLVTIETLYRDIWFLEENYSNYEGLFIKMTKDNLSNWIKAIDVIFEDN